VETKCGQCEYIASDVAKMVQHVWETHVPKGPTDVLPELEASRKVGGHDGDPGAGPPRAGDQSGGAGGAAQQVDVAIQQEHGTLRACWCCCNHVHNRRKPGEHCAECFGGYCLGGWHDGDGPIRSAASPEDRSDFRENPGAEARRAAGMARRAPYPTAKGWRHGDEK
jgi:hypothetical protein